MMTGPFRKLDEQQDNSDDDVAVAQNDDYYNQDDGEAISTSAPTGSYTMNDDASTGASDSSISTSIRATNCVTFTMEPRQDQFNVLIPKNQEATEPLFVSESSYVFFSHRGYDDDNADYSKNEEYDDDSLNFGHLYQINVQNWVSAFGIDACSSLSIYQDEIFSSASDQNEYYWGPICHPTNSEITMGVFLEEDCTVFAPALSDELLYYLTYYGDDNPNQDLLDVMYATSVLNNYYQQEYQCNSDDENGDDGGEDYTCDSILRFAVNDDSCQPFADDISSQSVTTFSSLSATVMNWFQYGDIHNYYHLSQNDLADPSSTCRAVNNAMVTNRYTFDEFLQTLEQEQDAAATLDIYHQEPLLSMKERLTGMVVAVILMMLGFYCCIATTRRLQRAHRKAMRRYYHEESASEAEETTTSIIYELGRTFTSVSSDGGSTCSSTNNGSKKEPLLSDAESTADITVSSTKYATSYTDPKRANYNGSSMETSSDESSEALSIIMEGKQSRFAKQQSKPRKLAKQPSNARKLPLPLLRWMQYGEKLDEDVFEGISITESDVSDDPFVGIVDDKQKTKRKVVTMQNEDNDSLFQDVMRDKSCC